MLCGRYRGGGRARRRCFPNSGSVVRVVVVVGASAALVQVVARVVVVVVVVVVVIVGVVVEHLHFSALAKGRGAAQFMLGC